MTAINFPVASGAFASVGACPVQLAATNVACKVVVADTQPSIGTSGTVLDPNMRPQTFEPVDGSSQAWVATLSGSGFVSALLLTGPFASGGGGGGVTFTDGTNTVLATELTVTGGTIGGTAPNATLDISGGSLTITDGDDIVSGVTQIMFSGAVVSGRTPDGLVTISGGSLTGVTTSELTALGLGTPGSSASGFQNVAIGANALAALDAGFDDVAVGNNALASNTSGINNTAVGDDALFRNTTGDSNTAVGDDALSQNTTGNNNTALGSFALYQSTSNDNIAIGYVAGSSVATANNTICIGATGVDTPFYLSIGDEILGIMGGPGIASSYGLGTGITTVAALPAPAAGKPPNGNEGMRYFVDDSLNGAVANFGVAVVGGGSFAVPVWCDGTAWYIG